MDNWSEISAELETVLKLKTLPVAYKRLESVEELGRVDNVRLMENRAFTFCQLPALVRYRGWTVGVTACCGISARCSRIHGLADPTTESMQHESKLLAKTWFGSSAQAMQQQQDYQRVPKGGAVVLAPLGKDKFDPDVVLVYGNPAQLMMILCGLQKVKYEQFHFTFIGEGACSDSLAKCYNERKPALTIPCYGERRFGEVTDDEMLLALPSILVKTALKGMSLLSKLGIRLPIPVHGAELDPAPSIKAVYGDI